MKYFVLVILFMAISCTEEPGVFNSNTYPEAPFFMIEPYPAIQINGASPLIGTVRPDKISNQIRLVGYHTGSPENELFTLTFLDTLSEFDLIPGDNVFRFSIPKGVLPLSDDLTMVVHAFSDLKETWADSISGIETLSNTTPVLTLLNHSDTLRKEPSTWSWEIEVTDPDPDEEIQVEIFARFQTGWLSLGLWLDDGNELDEVAGDKKIQAAFDSTARAGLTGNVNFRFVVNDKIQNSDTVTTVIHVINNAPVVKAISFPDTLIINPDSPSPSLFAIKIQDTETNMDIDSTVAQFYLPDGNFSSTFTDFNDDGQNGDETANDGWYSVLVSPSPSSTTGEWTIYIYARDRVNNKSNVIVHPIILKEK